MMWESTLRKAGAGVAEKNWWQVEKTSEVKLVRCVVGCGSKSVASVKGWRPPSHKMRQVAERISRSYVEANMSSALLSSECSVILNHHRGKMQWCSSPVETGIY